MVYLMSPGPVIDTEKGLGGEEMSDSGIRILLVDDENELVDYLAKRLKKKGHEVVGVSSGDAALEQVKSRIFDVAVLDLKMPQMDGIELLTHLKEEQPMLQAIMLTGHGSMESALESGRHRAFRFLVKPCEFEGLLETISEAAEYKREHQHTAYAAALEKVIATCTSSPHELIHETELLRKKYEQEG